MRSMLVIGAGRFGSNLAKKLTELGNEVLVVDTDENAINDLVPYVTRAQIGNCMDKSVLLSLGVRNFDICFVCISENFQSSMEISSLLKEIGAQYVVSKADREIQADLLLKIGADEVVYPELDMGAVPPSAIPQEALSITSSFPRNTPFLRLRHPLPGLATA